MDVRPATADDETKLYEVHRTVFRPHIEEIWGWDEDWQRAQFTIEFASSTTSVIEIEGRVIGYIEIRDDRCGGRAAASSCQDRARVPPCSCFDDQHPCWIDDPAKNFRRQSRLVTLGGVIQLASAFS